MFKDAINLIAEYPEIGKPTDNYDARIKIVRDYLIIYEIKKENIFILSIWNSRQNPEKLKVLLKK
ncbi:type II toxin-antitoxin system RelE/ParE family toxin [Flavobacterium sp. CS20]|uniref:type II toxin-antitoxin system RelE/ParE family toxin n=1 Tax=Flavobacterium sp. CS20 TaxID=2775246 RepID=UPI001B3A1492|nr:type II toxin-antitoxin system RelE/ParE family toxin [Flavobacterium sp. CS20]QTY26867.1 type II toxin-antitoxin system RelE/ParE family toxin [Flavobacterium sp. CS20]